MSTTVRVYFNDGTNTYTFPAVYQITDPTAGIKSTVIQGLRSSGSIVIPGGKKSHELIVRGTLMADDYNALTTLINEMRTKVTTNPATLKLQHLSGVNWVDDWSYSCRRIEEIRFEQSLRTSSQKYEIIFYVTSY